jgi:hypothetical protein
MMRAASGFHVPVVLVSTEDEVMGKQVDEASLHLFQLETGTVIVKEVGAEVVGCCSDKALGLSIVDEPSFFIISLLL